MADLVGTPSDDAPDILATGRSGVTTIFVSMSERHPEGKDADYLEWHTFDHRPEQQRLASLRTSVRVVSTPACRAARAASDGHHDGIDHVMTYFFSDIAGLGEFADLSVALRNAGRTPYVLPAVERGVYHLSGTAAAPRIKVGADVLPWWPMRGVYLLVERGEAPATGLTEVPGVGGAWWGTGIPVDPSLASAAPGAQITYCFLDDDPVATAGRLRPALEKRWADGTTEPLFAAPFFAIEPHETGRYVP
jgi:hypothetical protein